MPTTQKAVCDARMYHTQKTKLLSQFQTEHQKLEAMVAEHFASGPVNLGADVGILKQSGIIDRLIVDRMKLEEIYARHVDEKVSN